MLDFTASTYLGLRHARDDLQPWAQLTTGVPDALAEADGRARRVREAVASLVQGAGGHAGGLDPSRLLGSVRPVAAEQTARSSSTARPMRLAGGESSVRRRAASRSTRSGTTTRIAGASAARADRTGGGRSCSLTGSARTCGRRAPVAYLERRTPPSTACLLLDDTQAVGIFGCDTADASPYGHGGGGSLRWHDV